MANPVTVSSTLPTADADGIAAAQTLAAAGNVAINGALATGGVATLTSAGTARQVLITSAADDTGVVFTIYGTNATGNPIQENLTGTSGSTATSALYYRTVTRVYASAATAGDITIGTNGVGVSRVVNIDTALNPIQVTIVAAVSGTINYSLQWTDGDIQGSPVWTTDANMASKSGAFTANNLFPVSGYRMLINSGTGTVTATYLQSGLGS